jgi:hypothetical protein
MEKVSKQKRPMLLARALCLLAPRAGLGHYGRNFCFSLRNLPFGFLTQHIRGAFPLYSVGGILASSPAMEKVSKQKRPMLLARALCLLAPRAGLEPAT